MDEPILSVDFYRTDAGSEPVREWLRELTVEDRKAIGTDIKTVQLGWPLGMPLVRKMEPGLWEIRCDIADGISRVLFTVKDGQMVLLHGFVKKTQKTPDNELKTARNRLKKL
ncbi:MAG: type II toxin-antitoxin system RelE/ParE family toxin [Curvibacter sp.]|nr:type II toxin-antitoxin system RelE/ParE family toxin [Curvibacter sp.]